jgi:hypothetical protein
MQRFNRSARGIGERFVVKLHRAIRFTEAEGKIRVFASIGQEHGVEY